MGITVNFDSFGKERASLKKMLYGARFQATFSVCLYGRDEAEDLAKQLLDALLFNYSLGIELTELKRLFKIKSKELHFYNNGMVYVTTQYTDVGDEHILYSKRIGKFWFRTSFAVKKYTRVGATNRAIVVDTFVRGMTIVDVGGSHKVFKEFCYAMHTEYNDVAMKPSEGVNE